MTIRLWDAETGEHLGRPFEEHEHSVESVVFSPDGRHVISGPEDRAIQQSHSISKVCPSSEAFSAFQHLLIFSWQLSHQPDLPFMNPALHYPIETFRATRINNRGWFIGKNNELLLWVPPSLRKPDWTPASFLIIPQRLHIPNRLREMVHGQEWREIAARIK
jgi:WD40 repeat protein